MDVSISPFSIETGEYGELRGFVTRVSEYTVNNEAMRQVLQNDLLVQNLTANGAPYETTVCLLPDPSTVSGLEWTTRKGPPIQIRGGTLCSASVVVDQKRPVAFVVPFIRKKVLGFETQKWVQDDED
jgi:HlyD family secretion protein